MEQPTVAEGTRVTVGSKDWGVGSSLRLVKVYTRVTVGSTDWGMGSSLRLVKVAILGSRLVVKTGEWGAAYGW